MRVCSILHIAVILTLTIIYQLDAAECGSGKRPLFLSIDPRLTTYMPEGFGKNLLNQLDQPLQEIGYCITRFGAAAYNDSTMQDEFVMVISASFVIQNEQETAGFQNPDTSAKISVALVAVNQWKTEERRQSIQNPLLSLDYSPEEHSIFESVLIRKIIENLRMHYMCHLRIQSVPDGVLISSVNGLQGITPLEWITPLGKLPITGQLEGYEPITRKIDLSTPGTHTYVLQMQQRSFFHSPFFKPGIALCGVSALSFTLDWYFINQYRNFGENENKSNPRIFDRTYKTAELFQAIGITTLLLSGSMFTLSVIF